MKGLWTQNSSVTSPTYLHRSLLPQLLLHPRPWASFFCGPLTHQHHSNNNPLTFTETGFIPIKKTKSDSILLINPLLRQISRLGFFFYTQELLLLYLKLCSWLFTRHKYCHDSTVLCILSFQYFEFTASSTGDSCFLLQDATKREPVSHNALLLKRFCYQRQSNYKSITTGANFS